MADPIVDALAGESVMHANALAAVTSHCVVVRDGLRGARAVIAIDRIAGLKKVTTSKPGLLVISCGLLTLAAASYASKQGLEVTVPIAIIAGLFVMGYAGTRRAAILFVLENESIESIKGSFREATSIIRAVQRIRGEDETAGIKIE